MDGSTDPWIDLAESIQEEQDLVEQGEAHVLVLLLLLDLLLGGRGSSASSGGSRGSASDGNAASNALELLTPGGDDLLDVLTLELLDQEGGAIGVSVDTDCRSVETSETRVRAWRGPRRGPRKHGGTEGRKDGRRRRIPPSQRAYLGRWIPNGAKAVARACLQRRTGNGRRAAIRANTTGIPGCKHARAAHYAAKCLPHRQ